MSQLNHELELDLLRSGWGEVCFTCKRQDRDAIKLNGKKPESPCRFSLIASDYVFDKGRKPCNFYQPTLRQSFEDKRSFVISEINILGTILLKNPVVF